MLKKRLIYVSVVLLILIGGYFALQQNNKLKNQKELSRTKDKVRGKKSDNSVVIDQEIKLTFNQDNLDWKYEQKNTKPVNLQINSNNDKKTNSNVLGLISEKVDITVTLLSYKEMQPIPEYEVEASLIDEFDNGTSAVYKTDKEGKFIITSELLNSPSLQIITKDFSFYEETINLCLENNEVSVLLEKGGSIEIRVTNEKDQVLTAPMEIIFADPNGYGNQRIEIIKFDTKKNLYVANNLPLIGKKVSFKIKEYEETPLYDLSIELGKIKFFEIKLKPQRKIIVELLLKKKPNFIIIHESDEDSALHYLTKSSIPINSKGDYEILLTKRDISKIAILVENYLLAYCNILADQDIYKISLQKDFSAKVQLVDEKEIPIVGAKISYHNNSNYVTAFTDANGHTILSQLNETINIDLDISHRDFGCFAFNLKKILDSNKFEIYKIVFIKQIKVSGKIFFEEKPVANSLVGLYQINAGEETLSCLANSHLDRSFSFFYNREIYEIEKNEKNENKKEIDDEEGKEEEEENKEVVQLINVGDQEYILKAFHSQYGVGKTSAFTFQEESKFFDISLAKEKSVTIKLVDNKGEPLANKNLIIHNGNQYGQEPFSPFIESLLPDNWPRIRLKFITNENGEVDLFNFFQGYYEYYLEDERFYYFPENGSEVSESFKIPAEKVILVAESTDRRELVLTMPDGELYQGDLVVSRLGYGTDVLAKFIDAETFILDITKVDLHDAYLFVKSPGFTEELIGPFKDKNDFPDVLKIELKKGENIEVKVVSDQSGLALTSVKVEVLLGDTTIRTIQTNENGIVNLSQVSGNLIIKIEEENYTPYVLEFDCAQTKEVVVKLIKGGSIKGHLTISEDISEVSLLLDPSSKSYTLDENGKFEAFHLAPGSYSLTMNIKFKDGTNHKKFLPLFILVENEKTFDLDIDKMGKSHAKLKINLFKNNQKFKEHCKLELYDRQGRNDYSFDLVNGGQMINNIIPGEYQLKVRGNNILFNKQMTVLPFIENIENINIESALLTLQAKDEAGNIIPNICVSSILTEKNIQTFYYFEQSASLNKINSKIEIRPNVSYYFLVKDKSMNSNLTTKIMGPILLEPNQELSMEVVLPYARKLPNIQIVDIKNNPLSEAFYIFSVNNKFTFNPSYESRLELMSNKDGLLPANGWPKEKFSLMVCKKGYEFKEVVIDANFNSDQVLQIKLNKGSSILCNFNSVLSVPISVGILNSKGELVEKPILYSNGNFHELGFYYVNIAFGSVKFSELAAGTYFIGYFDNGSTKLISKEGPFKVGVEENLTVSSSFK